MVLNLTGRPSSPVDISPVNESAPLPSPTKRTIIPTRLCQTCPSELTEDQEPWMKQCVGCFKDDQTKRNCAVCERPRIVINDERWKTVCNQCFKDAALKPCGSCREPKIRAYESWRTLCKDCFADKKWKRTCEVCEERPIKDDLPAYVKSCTKCYMDKRRIEFASCPLCPPDKQHLLSRRMGAPSCRDCMNDAGLIVKEPLMKKKSIWEPKLSTIWEPVFGNQYLRNSVKERVLSTIKEPAHLY